MSSSRRAQWDIEGYGWSAVPRNRSNVPNAKEVNEIPADDIEDHQDALAMANEINVEDVWPITALTEKARAYAKQELSTETFNHSLRVHAYGMYTPLPPMHSHPTNTSHPVGYYMITRHFGNWIGSTFFETWALTCLFHDIGTTPKNMADTHLSFEFQGGMIALTKLLEFGAPKIQAESVMEAIIRHQDPGETGMISAMGQMIQLATEFGTFHFSVACFLRCWARGQCGGMVTTNE
jgi:cyanamide hydratase